MGWIAIIVIVLIICSSILFSEYMDHCSKNQIGVFKDPRYDERIRNLEKILDKLKED